LRRLQRCLRRNFAGQRGCAVFCTASLAFVQKQRLLRQYLYFCTGGGTIYIIYTSIEV
jgi:hypothetical protein